MVEYKINKMKRHTMLEQVSYLRLSGEKIRHISNLSEFVTIKSLYLNDVNYIYLMKIMNI